MVVNERDLRPAPPPIPNPPANLFPPPPWLGSSSQIFERKGHCVICVAEGAGQDCLESSCEMDASGNPILQVSHTSVKKCGKGVEAGFK